MLLDAHGLDKFIMAYDSLVDRDHMQRNSNGLSNRLELDKNIPYSVATMRMLIMNKLYEQGNVVQEFKYNDLVYKTDELKYKADFVLVTDRLKSYGIKNGHLMFILEITDQLCIRCRGFLDVVI